MIFYYMLAIYLLADFSLNSIT